jgi:hypothetical protein
MTAVCVDCNIPLPLQVLHSAAGYYLGYWCPKCGPYGRMTGYYKTRAKAEAALANPCTLCGGGACEGCEHDPA